MKISTLVLVLALALPILVGAEDSVSLDQMRQAAEQGKAEAQLEMGILYEFGYNFPKHNVNAMAWYLCAAEQGLAKAIERRDQLKSQLTAEELTEAQKLSAELISKKTEGTAETPKAEPTAPAPVTPEPQAPVPEAVPTQAPAPVPAATESKPSATP
jgi:TPR repeat protein